jgi:acyl-CoA thioesterase I
MPDAPGACVPHPDLVAFKYPLPHLTESLKRGRRTKVVAIGSSSTAGEPSPSGEVKIVPFPARLELALRRHNYGCMVDVLNRGLGGQEAPEELSRFESDVIAEAPALVIWQVGTNAVFHDVDYNPLDIAAAIAAGLSWLAPLAMDVVLMDLQYTTAVVVPDGKLGRSELIEKIILDAADAAKVNVFRRWALMGQWIKDGIPLTDLTDPEDTFAQLHMSEWATACVSQALYDAIAGAPPPTA